MKRTDDIAPLATQLGALAEPLRLRIARLLERAELSVGEVGRVVQLPQSTISRHLRVLSDAGWTIRRSEGPATLYRVVLDDLPGPMRAVWIAIRDSLGKDPLAAEIAADELRLGSVLAERREDSRAFFGRVAGQWDDVRTELFGSRFTAAALLGLLDPAWTVADVGCGTGNAAELLAPVVRRVVAIDQSAPMLNAARKRLAGAQNVEFRAGDLESLPLGNGEVDAAVCTLVLHHVPEPGRACREFRRVIRPGGRLLVVDMLEHDRVDYRHSMGHRWLGFSAEQVGAWLSAAGFGDVRFAALPPDAEAKGPGLFAATAQVPEPSG